MFRTPNTSKIDAGAGQLRWVILLLAIAVILPTVCLLWFMNSAVKNQRLAVRQRLVDSYKDSLAKLKEYNEDVWLRLTEIPARTSSTDLRDFVATVVRTKNHGMGDYDHGDAVLVYDPNGALLYPAIEDYRPDTSDVNKSLWRLEFVDEDYVAAAEEYQKIADVSADKTAKLRAQIAAVRNLKKAHDTAGALAECDRIIRAARLPDIRQFNLLMQLCIMQIRLSRDAGASDYPKLVEQFFEQATEHKGIRDYASA